MYNNFPEKKKKIIFFWNRLIVGLIVYAVMSLWTLIFERTTKSSTNNVFFFSSLKNWDAKAEINEASSNNKYKTCTNWMKRSWQKDWTCLVTYSIMRCLHGKWFSAQHKGSQFTVLRSLAFFKRNWKTQWPWVYYSTACCLYTHLHLHLEHW